MEAGIPKAFVVGHPIGHSRSPLIHRHWLAEHGIAGSYDRFDVAPQDFPAFLRRLPENGFAGGNVTIPHKEAAFALVERLTAQAFRIGAVNTVFIDESGHLWGDNTDAPGFVAHLDHSLPPGWADRSGGRALVLGAGGAARAVVVGLLDRGLTRILVANRTRGRADALSAIDRRVTPVDWDSIVGTLGGVGLLVNTTALGMRGQPPLDLDLGLLPGDAAVADIVYDPLETLLLMSARRHGLAAVDGLGMLLHQAVPGFERWFGLRPTVTTALRERLVADLAR